jgi:hypothetical protein
VADEIERLIRDMGRVPDDLRKRLRPKLREAGRIVADDAKLRSSWSTRIPRAIRVATSFTKTRPGVSVIVNKNKAPHARPFEHGGDPGTFRHPVFGNREVWVSQRARPFLEPALEAKGDEAGRRITEAVDETTRDAGFH